LKGVLQIEDKDYIVYIDNNNLFFGYIDYICNCEKCKERGEAEIKDKNQLLIW